ncbi:MAG: hypothetical protein HN509_08670 [Halobacteriovoraceae bacterium]|jgi:hypothetical protein|nr:hypothetical protein [Halobacteriovoraceae bacterium]MBT5093452.1 hypothetical protein [Halobacteriovoraceae bacterium]
MSDSKSPKFSKNGEDLFINKLLEETYSFMPENDACKDSKDLLLYFNNKANNSVGEETVTDDLQMATEVNLEFIPDLFCFRLSHQSKDIDFPSNWSLFEELRNSLESGKRFFCRVDRDDNRDQLHDILSEVVSYPCHAIFYVNEGKAGISMCPSDGRKISEEAFFRQQVFGQSKLKAA